MKKYIIILISMFMFVPFVVKAETITYNICKNGCEYTGFSEVGRDIYLMQDLTDKDIIINVTDNESYEWPGSSVQLGRYNSHMKSLTINGGNARIVYNDDYSRLYVYADRAEFENVIFPNKESNVIFNNTKKINLINSKISLIQLGFLNEDETNIIEEQIKLADTLELDHNTLNNLKAIRLLGNFKIENMDFSNQLIQLFVGTIDIYNSKVNKMMSIPDMGNITLNIYNSIFNTLKHKNITSYEEYSNEFGNLSLDDLSAFNYDIYDVNISGLDGISTTTVYFEKETKLKTGGKLNLAEFLDYYTEDKEIEYTIEDESIAKIENKELIGLKEGSTNITVTTDEGHVVYRINLVVEKESLTEKIDKMTIKVPITGSVIKEWVIGLTVLIIGVIGMCSYILIKRKK